MNLQAKLAKLEEVKSACQTASPARERITALFDEGTFVELDGFVACGSEGVGVITGYGAVEGSIVYAFSQDVTTMGGAVSKAHAEKIAKLYDLAVKNGAPVVAIFDSNGAKISEGQEVLASYQKILALSNNLSGVVPQVAVVAGSCVGISAMMAASADILVMAEDAELYLTAGTDASAKAAAEHGIAHVVCEDAMAAVQKAREIVSVLPLNNLSIAPISEGAEAAAAAFDNTTASADLTAAICDAGSVIELKADFTKHVFTALATLGGSTVGIVSIKGTICSTCITKITSFVRFCDSFSLPVITFVDNEGFKEGTCPAAAARLSAAYADATTAKISVYTGSVIGAAGVAFAAADLRIAWPTAIISALAPATAVEFFWHDKLKGADDVAAKRAELEELYADTEASPFEAAKAGMVEDIIAPAATRSTLIAALDALASKRVSRLPKKHSC
ncbi:MAG: carboxyl transferase domain-containing protein [Oscillospiraceae bacterium]|nr:carboxyl transferase domain-containing protein [Oscillospiraceae bacterium]